MSKLVPHADFIRQALADGRGKASIAKELGVPRTTLNSFIEAGFRTTRKPMVVADAPAGGDPSETEILKHQVAELRAALRKDRKSTVADERLLRAIESACKTVTPQPLPVPSAAIKRVGSAHHRAVLLLSDFHGGERVDPQVVNGLNEFDWEIMEARVEELLAAVESHMRHMPKLSGLDVGLVGDMCSGANHEEIKETNQYVMAEQGVRMAYLQAQILGRLSALVPDLRVFAVEGNHPRFEKKPAAKNPHNNMDWVAACFTREMVQRDLGNVSHFEVGSGSLFWEVAGRKAYVFHGDGIMSNMVGVPWGGVMRRSNGLQATYPFEIHHFWLGHYHQANVVQSGRIAMNGSLKGVDEWCLKKFAGGDAPTQLMLVFDERAERMTDVKYITPRAGL